MQINRSYINQIALISWNIYPEIVYFRSSSMTPQISGAGHFVPEIWKVSVVKGILGTVVTVKVKSFKPVIEADANMGLNNHVYQQTG